MGCSSAPCAKTSLDAISRDRLRITFKASPKVNVIVSAPPMELTVQNGAFLLLIAVVVAMLTQKLNLPCSAGLVAAGIFLAFSRFSPIISLTKDLLFTVLLPPLIFQAAFYIEWRRLRRDLGVILVLATVGVVLSAAITTLGMHYLASWQWEGA